MSKEVKLLPAPGKTIKNKNQKDFDESLVMAIKTLLSLESRVDWGLNYLNIQHQINQSRNNKNTTRHGQ